MHKDEMSWGSMRPSQECPNGCRAWIFYKSHDILPLGAPRTLAVIRSQNKFSTQNFVFILSCNIAITAETRIKLPSRSNYPK